MGSAAAYTKTRALAGNPHFVGTITRARREARYLHTEVARGASSRDPPPVARRRKSCWIRAGPTQSGSIEPNLDHSMCAEMRTITYDNLQNGYTLLGEAEATV